MRIALHPTTETGHRAGRILLGEPELEALGIYGHRSRSTEDRRSMAITELTGFELLISDDATAPLDLAAIAAEDGLSCVLAADPTPPPLLAARFARQGLILLLNANTAGLAETLPFHEALRTGPGWEVLVAWTTEAKPLRRGVAVPFPDPLGARWGRRLPAGTDPPSSPASKSPSRGPGAEPSPGPPGPGATTGWWPSPTTGSTWPPWPSPRGRCSLLALGWPRACGIRRMRLPPTYRRRGT